MNKLVRFTGRLVSVIQPPPHGHNLWPNSCENIYILICFRFWVVCHADEILYTIKKWIIREMFCVTSSDFFLPFFFINKYQGFCVLFLNYKNIKFCDLAVSRQDIQKFAYSNLVSPQLINLFVFLSSCTWNDEVNSSPTLQVTLLLCDTLFRK